MRVWSEAGRQWVGCVGHHIIVLVFGIFMAMFGRLRARLYYYGGNRLTQRLHHTHISSLGSHNSKDSLAGCAILHTFPRPRPRTWTARAAKSTLTKRNATCPVAAPSASIIPDASAAELMARRHAPTIQSHEDVPHTSPIARKGTRSPLPLSPPLARKTYATAPATVVVAASKQLVPDQSRQSSPSTICVRVSIDERRHQVVHFSWPRIPPRGEGSGFWRCTLFASHNTPLLSKVEEEIKD